MIADFLASPPTSGTMLERNYGVPGGGGVWVKFHNPSGNDWAGVFPAGYNDCCAVCRIGDSRAALVIANGGAYGVEIESGKLLFSSSSTYLFGCVAIPSQVAALAWDNTQLYVFTLAGETWQSGYVACDGIEVLPPSGQTVTGAVCEHDGWYQFTLTFPELRLEIGRRLAAPGAVDPWAE